MKTETDLERVGEGPRACALLQHPLRPAILAHARTPRSASDIAAALGHPRQRVNYHVRALAKAGFLTDAGQHRKRNMWEQRWVATARSYMLAPECLGPLSPNTRSIEDRFSAEYLLALASRVQTELGTARQEARDQGKRLATLSVDAALRFTSAEQRERFTGALREAIEKVIAEHSAPFTKDDGEPAAGRPYRLALGCYPIPPQHENAPTESPKENGSE